MYFIQDMTRPIPVTGLLVLDGYNPLTHLMFIRSVDNIAANTYFTIDTRSRSKWQSYVYLYFRIFYTSHTSSSTTLRTIQTLTLFVKTSLDFLVLETVLLISYKPQAFKTLVARQFLNGKNKCSSASLLNLIHVHFFFLFKACNLHFIISFLNTT